jgi:hypothetical protein
MAFGKVTWSYYDPGFGDGWTDTLYSGQTDMSLLIANAQALAAVRWPLMGTGQKISYIRAAIVNPGAIGGGSQLIYCGNQYVKNGPFSPPKPGDSDDNPDNPWQVILLNCLSATPGKTKRMYMRGVPDRIEVNPPGPLVIDDANYLAFYNAWVSVVTNGQWGWLARVNPPAKQGGVTSIAYTAGVYPAAAYLTITTDTNHGLLKNAQVQFRKGKMQPRLRGVYTVASVPSLTAFTIPVNMVAAPVVQVTPNWNDVTLGLQVITAVNVDGETSHRVGRPTGQSRGRRKHVLPTA